MKLEEPSRLEKAYHEAGHAVIGIVLRLPVSFCSIVTDPPMCELHEDYPTPTADDEKDCFAMFLLAGITAQFHFHRAGSRPWHCGTDDEQIGKLGIENRLAWLRDDVFDQVKQNEESIRRVAQELLQWNELSGEEIQKIVEKGT